MTYLIELTHSDGIFYGYRNSKNEWVHVVSKPEATSFKTEKGAWRAIQKGNSDLVKFHGSACWHDLLQKRGFKVNVINTTQDT